MELYNNAGIATYTELIMGLPGETYESLADGVDELLRLGQHNSIYFHNCEWLPCSIMGQKDYVEKYKIKTSRIPLHQPHRETDDADEIPEESSVVTSTYSMTAEDWKKMNLFSSVVHSCHHMGLLQFFALYLYNEGVCSYKEFYSSLLDFALSNPDTVIGSVFCKIQGYLDAVTEEKGTLCCTDERFGKVQWPFEEYAYLCMVYDSENFYGEITDFLEKFGIDKEIYIQLLDFQKKIIKKPFDEKIVIDYAFNFVEYFMKLIDGKEAELGKENIHIELEAKPFDSWAKFARIVAWYGRKDSFSTYIKQAYLKRSN
jgi:putative methyltransferase